MLDSLFGSVTAGVGTGAGFLLSMLVSLLCGLLIAFGYMFRNEYSRTMVLSLAVLPAIVQVVISMVNGSIGAGVAVAGAFSLIRFRSAPGTAKDILFVFLAMAAGLASGMGYLGLALSFTVILLLVLTLYTALNFGTARSAEKDLRVLIPENLDYSGLFDDIFSQYAQKATLERVKTSNMGSLYQLTYTVVWKDCAKEKECLDAIRCRNGNLDVFCGQKNFGKDEL